MIGGASCWRSSQPRPFLRSCMCVAIAFPPRHLRRRVRGCGQAVKWSKFDCCGTSVCEFVPLSQHHGKIGPAAIKFFHRVVRD